MNEENKSILEEEKESSIDFGKIFQDLLKHKRLYYKVLPVAFVLAAIYALAQPNYYNCTVKLSPEMSGSKSTSGLASLASSFGVNLGGGGAGTEALFPTLYPDLVNSTDFKTTLFHVPVTIEGDKEKGEIVRTMSYYDYLSKEQKVPWWSAAMKALFSLFKSSDIKPQPSVNPFRLTKEQAAIVKTINNKVVCDVDKKTMVITINVTDQDPLIAATMADSVQVHLQNFITDYRTRKARIDLAYSQKLYKEAQQRYEKARQKSASYNDANHHVFMNSVRSKQIKLENELALQYQAYSQVATQLQIAEAKVQENTPAFTLLQPATVPVKKAGPARARTCLIVLFLAFLATSLWVIHREGHLLPFIFSED